MTIRTLVLSGGGGRGAFHAGVYKYLTEHNKANVDAEHQGPWVPDVVVGTSIGAVNGAAIAQGLSAADLEQFWLSLREHDVQGLPPGMGWLARRVLNTVFRNSIGVPLPHLRPTDAMSPPAAESWPPIPVLPKRLSTMLIGRWSNMLDTGPLYKTLQERLKIDPEKLSESETTLLISATNVRTGEAVVFSNKEFDHLPVNAPDSTMKTPITIRRIIASCSIPMVYPWTKDEDGQVYWDGAVLANTPLGPAFDAVRDHPLNEEMEAVIVMMTPWWEQGEYSPAHEDLPQDFGEAMTWTLDWALLSSFRVDLKLMRSCNEICNMEVAMGKPQRFRIVKDIIVAPDQFLPVTRIIDYDEPASRDLVEQGYNAAKRAFEAKFATNAEGQSST